MSAAGWRNVSIGLALLCAFLWWRGNRHAPASAAPHSVAAPSSTAPTPQPFDDDDDNNGAADPASGHHTGGSDDEHAARDDGDVDGFGISIPAWVYWFAPQPGEDLAAYRDRLLPIVQAAVAPHRARVAQNRADFEAAAHLDAKQKAALDAAVSEASDAIENRVMESAMSGEMMPDRFKPTTAVALARDVLDSVDNANRSFLGSLSDDQREALAQHPFDLADYILFATRWEDMLGVPRE